MTNLEISEICGRTVCLKGNLLKAYVALHKLGCPVLVREGDTEQQFFISAETATEQIWCNYYDMGYPYINPQIERTLEPLHVGVDWENPGCLVCFNN